jgi:hypothetical protein
MPETVTSCTTAGAKKGHRWCFVMEEDNLTVMDCQKKRDGTFKCKDVTMHRTIPRRLRDAVLAALVAKRSRTSSSKKGR